MKFGHITTVVSMVTRLALIALSSCDLPSQVRERKTVSV